jgi:hypothetical protein
MQPVFGQAIPFRPVLFQRRLVLIPAKWRSKRFDAVD